MSSRPVRPAAAGGASPGARCSRPARCRCWRWSPGAPTAPPGAERGDRRRRSTSWPPRSRCRSAGRRLRRRGRRRPRPGRRGRPSWPTRPRAQLDAAAGGRPGRSPASATSPAAPRRPAPGDARAVAARPGGRGGGLARRRLPGPVRRPGGAAGLASPRDCAGRTGSWHDRRPASLTDGAVTERRPRPGRPGPRTPRCRTALAAEHAAVWGYGVGRVPRWPATTAARSRPPREAHRDLRDRVTALLADRGRRPGRRAGRPTRCRSRCSPPSTPRALAVVLEDGVAAAWVRVLDQAAERVRPASSRVGRPRRAEVARRSAGGRGRADPGARRRPRACPGRDLPAAGAQPSAPRKASVTSTATLLDCPASTRTAKAMSPCGPPSW